MPDQRSKPPQMPAGASSLSERIAALQRKASDSGRPSSASGQALGSGSGGYNTSGMGRTASSSSNSSSSHQQNTSFGSTSSSFAAAESGPSSTLSPQSKAVRDRIAKFQQSTDESPILPRSSFGAPAPNPENDRLRVHRPYPGASAAGGGSGRWGEGVLRPQMTGGAWLGNGSGSAGMPRGPSSLAPQLTGPTWSRRQASSPETFASRDRIGGGPDAFAELDSRSSSLRGLGSHAGDVASQAAAMRGLSLSPNSAAQKRSSIVISPSLPSPSEEIEIGSQSLPILPDTPTQELPSLPATTTTTTTNGTTTILAQEEKLPHLPSAPSDIPQDPFPPPRSPIPTDGHSNEVVAADTSIEISVTARNQEEMELIRKRAKEVQEQEEAEEQANSSIHSTNGQAATIEAPTSATTTKDIPVEVKPSPLPTTTTTTTTTPPPPPPPPSIPAASTSTNGTSTSSQPANHARKSTIRRPPPGRVMSVAEMDASDDEYEPGWASVVSRT
ncbi:unnamed protein product [Sympodiomycopsis kandeliae]